MSSQTNTPEAVNLGQATSAVEPYTPSVEPVCYPDINPALSANRTELNGVILDILLTDGPMIVTDLYDRTMIDRYGKPSGVLDRKYFRVVVDRIGSGAVELQPGRGRFKEFTLTEDGKRAAVLGGHLLDYSATTNKSIGEVMGPFAPASIVAGVPRQSTYTARIEVMKSLLDHDHAGWIPAGDIYEDIADSGPSGVEHSVAFDHLGALVDVGLIERDTMSMSNGGWMYKYRVKKLEETGRAKGSEDSPSDLAKFFTIIKRYAQIHKDGEFITEGLAHAERFAHTPSLIAYMVHRTYRNVPLNTKQALRDSIRGNGANPTGSGTPVSAPGYRKPYLT